MTPKIITSLFCIMIVYYAVFPGCSKEKLRENYSFTEEFENVSSIGTKGWAFADYGSNGFQWRQGHTGDAKTGEGGSLHILTIRNRMNMLLQDIISHRLALIPGC